MQYIDVKVFVLKMIHNSCSLFFVLFGGSGFQKLVLKSNKDWKRSIHLSARVKETFVSGVVLKGRQIKVSQHYFEEPVLQPRSATNQRREADLTGLKG